MSKNRQKNLEIGRKRTVNFFLGLLFSIGVSIALLLYLLEQFSIDALTPSKISGEPSLGIPILLAGISGIIGTCLVPLVFQRNNTALTKDFNKLDRYDYLKRYQLLYPITQTILYVVCGFCVAAGALVMTSALLNKNDLSYSPYGIITFGGLVGYFLGLALTKSHVSSMYENLGGIPDVVSTFGDIEEEIFGEPLINFDGHIVARWEASNSNSPIAGTLFIHMESNSFKKSNLGSKTEKTYPSPIFINKQSNYRNDSVDISQDNLTLRRHILVQGGINDDVVPFAISVISQEFDVEPQRLILAAPSEGGSETLSFKFLYLSNDINDKKEVYTTILINVSQAGRTIQLCDMEVPI